MDWIICTKSYITVVEMGSIAQAASQLNISSSALSKRLTWLENQLNIQLLNRTTRHLTMTEAGCRFFQQGKQLVDNWTLLIAETTSHYNEISGILKIGSSLTISSNSLIPLIGQFLIAYPKLQVEFQPLAIEQLSAQYVDILIAPTLTNATAERVITCKLFESQARFFASPSYLSQHPPIHTDKQLSQHNCLLLETTRFQQQHHFESDLCLHLHSNFFSTNIDSLIDAAVAGFGIILVSDILIKKQREQGLLIPVLPAVRQAHTSTYAYYSKDDSQPLRAKLFIDFIKNKWGA